MPNHSFEPVSAFYDALARLVFGNVLIQSQEAFLDDIPENSSVLIIGGGSGAILEAVLQQGHCKSVVYLEASETMLAKAQQNTRHLPNFNKAEFRLGTETTLKPSEKFDVLLTNFFLDLFEPAALNTTATILYNVLAAKGLWFATDFIQPAGFNQRSIRAKLLLKCMYLFFRLTCGISAKSLPDWENQLLHYGLISKKTAYFYSGMIKSIVLQKKL